MMNLQESILIEKRFLLLLFCFFLILNFATSGGHIYSSDDLKYFLHTESLALNNSLKFVPESPSVDKLLTPDELKIRQKNNYNFQGKEWSEETPLVPFFTFSPLLLPFITVPFYHLSIFTSLDPIVVLNFFTNSIIISSISLIIFLTSMHFFKSKGISFVLALVFLVTTWIWGYNTGMMLRPLAALCILSGFYFIITSNNESRYKPLIAGIVIGLGQLASYSTIIIIPGLILFGIVKFRKEKKQIFFLLMGILFLLLIQAELNDYRFGSYSDFGVGVFQDISARVYLEGIPGFIFSLSYGVFFNAPLLVLFPFAIYLILRKGNISLGLFLAYSFLISWIYFGTGPPIHWTGFVGYGPRYFTTILPLLIISLGFLMKEYSNKRIFNLSFVGLAMFGFFVSFVGKLVWFYYGFSYGWLILKMNKLENLWTTLRHYDFGYSTMGLNLKALTTPEFIPSLEGTPDARWGLTPCLYDLYIYCELGIVLFILILTICAMVGLLILKTLLRTPDIKNDSSNFKKKLPTEHGL